MMKAETMLQRFRKWLNLDHAVDLCVDLFLILFDVLSSPILIVMRLIRWVVGTFMLDRLKSNIKRIIQWALSKPRWLQCIFFPVLILFVAYTLMFMWIFGQAFGEFVAGEWGKGDLNE